MRSYPEPGGLRVVCTDPQARESFLNLARDARDYRNLLRWYFWKEVVPQTIEAMKANVAQ